MTSDSLWHSMYMKHISVGCHRANTSRDILRKCFEEGRWRTTLSGCLLPLSYLRETVDVFRFPFCSLRLQLNDAIHMASRVTDIPLEWKYSRHPATLRNDHPGTPALKDLGHSPAGEAVGNQTDIGNCYNCHGQLPCRKTRYCIHKCDI